jgi:hypothetical protein
VRFLLVLPLMLMAENFVDPWLSRTVRDLLETGVVRPEGRASLEKIISRAQQSVASLVVGPILLLLAVVVEVTGLRVTSLNASTWYDAPSLARIWFLFVAMPIFRFIAFRWLWWLVLWAWLLWKISGLPLRLDAAHADKAGGLGFLIVGHSRFALVLLAFSANVAAQLGERMVYEGATLAALKPSIIGFVVVSCLVMLAPLLFFNRRLLRAKDEGLLEYGAFGVSYTQAFHRKWIEHSVPGVEALGSQDIQALSDFDNAFSVVHAMKVSLLGGRVLVPFGLAAVVPMAPLLLAEVPLDQILRTLLKALG